MARLKPKMIKFAGYQKALTSLVSNENFILESANKVYVQSGFKLLDSFLQTTKKNYLAEAEALDFAESQMAVTIINNFVEKMTNGTIKDFLQSINPATRFYLLNFRIPC
jgi:serine protease inhibitor